MKKSITTNDTIAFCYHLKNIIKNAQSPVLELIADRATEAWLKIAIATKHQWEGLEKEFARNAVVEFVESDFCGTSYSASVMANFLNEMYRNFTGKACKEV